MQSTREASAEPSGQIRAVGERDPRRWHLLAIGLLSVAYESRFLHHGLNRLDESWPLYAGMRLASGGTLYQDIFFVFPPGHALVGWLAWVLDPPGFILQRVLHGAFCVALSLLGYQLARRLMSPWFAFLAAAMLAVSAPYSHLSHHLFGFRYLALGIPALLCFGRRLDTGDARWMLLAGVSVGVSLFFRLTPALALLAALAVGSVVAERSPRAWIRDGAWLALGFLAVTLPVLGYFATTVGLEKLWLEVVVRPVAMTDAQSLPVPPLELPPVWERREIQIAFGSLQYRVYSVLYLVYGTVLVTRYVRSLLARRRFESPILFCVATWGGIFFLRSFGRSDIAHLESALPPAILLTAHALWVAWRRLFPAARFDPERRRIAGFAMASLAFTAWVVVPGADRVFEGHMMGTAPFHSLGEQTRVRPSEWNRVLDERIQTLRLRVGAGDRVLDLSSSPIFYVLSGRLGPGYADIVMPGTFLDEEEEEAFLRRLREDPPAWVIWPARAFDRNPARAVDRVAPRVTEWTRKRYAIYGERQHFILLEPRSRR